MSNYELFQLATYGNILRATPSKDIILENGATEAEEFEEWTNNKAELELINFDND